MLRHNLFEHFDNRLQQAETDLMRLKTAIEIYGLRINERDINGERDITAQYLEGAEAACEEYRRLIREWPDA